MSLSRDASCWENLQIEPTEDKKLIKRAYHKLLRQYKPDEKPNEFKILYEAYQDALEWEDYGWMDEDIEESDNEEFNEFELLEEIDWEDEEWEEEEETSALQNDYYERSQKFEEKVDELTYNNNYPELFNQLERWKFLEEIDVTSDLEFYKEASNYLFEAVSEFDGKHPTLLLNEEVIRYFDKLFLWKQFWQEYDNDSSIFDYLEVKKEIFPKERVALLSKNLATFKQRGYAFLIDMIIAFSITLVFNGVSLPTPSSVLMVYVGIQALLVWGLGFNTLGQFALRLEVSEGIEREKPTKAARGIRLLFTVISLLPLFWFKEHDYSNATFYLLILAMSGILLFYKKRLLQDYSGTRVYSMG